MPLGDGALATHERPLLTSRLFQHHQRPTLDDPMPPQRTAPSARSKKKQTGEPGISSASWNDDDVNFLIDQVFARRAEAGDGLNFKKAFWQSIAGSPDLSNPAKGAPKTWSACKDKWSRVSTIHLESYILHISILILELSSEKYTMSLMRLRMPPGLHIRLR